MMLPKTLISLFERDLNRVMDELELYQSETDIWKLEGDFSGSSGDTFDSIIWDTSIITGD